jgi:NAD(P)-dependent dehydrogenase (short-subunit alcohol dehydrogenase family)
MGIGRLDGKVALVTGASSGIGRCTAELFAREGAAVVVTARRAEKLEALAESITKAGGRALAVPGDVRSDVDVKNVVDQTVAAFGRIDILVNNAGILDRHMPAIRTTNELWDDVIASDLTQVFYFCRAVLPHMVETGTGSIVNVASIGGIYMSAGVAYSSAKAGVNGLTRNIALQYSGTGIRCNSVNPGPTPTEANTPEKLAAFDKEFQEICAKHQFWAGESEAIDQANAILFFASDESRYVTGQWLVVDRGMNL